MIKFLLVSGAIIVGIFFGNSADASEGALTVLNFPTPSYQKEYFWEIEKFSSPDNWELFKGDSGISIFMIRANRSIPISSNYSVTGIVHIGNYDSTVPAIITGVTNEFSDGTISLVGCPVSFPYTLNPGKNILCAFSAAFPDGTTRTNTSTVTTIGEVTGGSDGDIVDFSLVSPSIVNGSVTISDTNGKSWIFSGTSAVSYEKTFRCNSDEGAHENTATIIQTGQSSTEEVIVRCYEPNIEEQNQTSYSRAHSWKIKKEADVKRLVLPKGESYPVNYTVTAFADGVVDLGWKVSGEITISNPHPARDANIISISDTLTLDGAVIIDCGNVTILPAGESIVCNYYKEPSSGNAQINTATTRIKNHSFHPRNPVLEIGFTDISAIAPVTFGEPAEQIDETAEVSDSEIGALGVVTIDTAPKIFNYSSSVGFAGDEACGSNILQGTATITAGDSQISNYDTSDIEVFISCGTGCVHSLGFWKTHIGEWPNIGDWDFDLTPEQENEDLVSHNTWLSVFRTSPKGNLWYQLAHQWMAAYLNVLGGADISVLGVSLNDAWSWLEDFAGVNVSPRDVSQAKNWLSLFSYYNKGLIGPESCQ